MYTVTFKLELPDGMRLLVVFAGILASWTALAQDIDNVVTPDGRKLYVACGRSGTVSVIDTERNVKLTDIVVGKLPWGVAIR